MSIYPQIESTTTWLVPRNESDPEGEELRAMVVGHIVGILRDELRQQLPPEQFESIRELFVIERPLGQ